MGIKNSVFFLDLNTLDKKIDDDLKKFAKEEELDENDVVKIIQNEARRIGEKNNVKVTFKIIDGNDDGFRVIVEPANVKYKGTIIYPYDRIESSDFKFKLDSVCGKVTLYNKKDECRKITVTIDGVALDIFAMTYQKAKEFLIGVSDRKAKEGYLEFPDSICFKQYGVKLNAAKNENGDIMVDSLVASIDVFNKDEFFKEYYFEEEKEEEKYDVNIPLPDEYNYEKKNKNENKKSKTIAKKELNDIDIEIELPEQSKKEEVVKEETKPEIVFEDSSIDKRQEELDRIRARQDEELEKVKARLKKELEDDLNKNLKKYDEQNAKRLEEEKQKIEEESVQDYKEEEKIDQQDEIEIEKEQDAEIAKLKEALAEIQQDEAPVVKEEKKATKKEEKKENSQPKEVAEEIKPVEKVKPVKKVEEVQAPVEKPEEKEEIQQDEIKQEVQREEIKTDLISQMKAAIVTENQREIKELERLLEEEKKQQEILENRIKAKLNELKAAATKNVEVVQKAPKVEVQDITEPIKIKEPDGFVSYEIESYKGLKEQGKENLALYFGQDKKDIRKYFGGKPKEIRDYEEMELYDIFYAYYDDEDKCTGIGIYNQEVYKDKIALYMFGQNLITMKYRDIVKLIKKNDYNAIEDDDGIISLKYGISVDPREDSNYKDEIGDIIHIFKKGYYDEVYENF